MKRIAIAVCVVVLVFAVAAWAQTPAKPKSVSVEQQLMNLEKEWGDALVKPDLAFLDRILANDYVDTSSDGDVTTKAQDIADLKSREAVYASWVTNEMKVHVYGDAAVVFGLSSGKVQIKGRDVSGSYRWTDAWIKKAGVWQCVATHSSRIAQK